MSWLTPDERRRWDEIVDHFRRDTLEKIAGSAIVMSIAPAEGEFDVQYACELGASIILDKPILVVALPGRPVPAKLRQIADQVVVCDIDTQAGQQQLRDAVEKMGIPT